MSYTEEHKRETKERIVQSARRLFNRKGLNHVSIKEIMQEAGLTHGGFYHHFSSKDELYVEAVDSYSCCNPTEKWDDVEVDLSAAPDELASQMIDAYLSRGHLEDVDWQCPMIALPSDVARASPVLKQAYERAVLAMVEVFSGKNVLESRERALSIVAVCVGGMVLARTLDNVELATEIRDAARKLAHDISG